MQLKMRDLALGFFTVPPPPSPPPPQSLRDNEYHECSGKASEMLKIVFALAELAELPY